MIVCRKCGFHNGDADAFCGSCGSFLEFTGDKITPVVSTEFRQQVEEEAAAPPAKRGLLDRMEGAVMSVLGPLPPDLVPAEEPAADGADAEPPDASTDASTDAEPAPVADSPASDLVAPIVPPLPQPREPADQPTERTPQATRELAAAVTKTKPTRRLRPGDLICGQCGEGNPPVRRFCGRCGDSLDRKSVV